MAVDPLNEIIEQDLIEQLTGTFEGVNTALRMMQADMTRFVLERLRIDSLTRVNYSAVPLYDASHPHWKEDLTNTTLEDTDFFRPVARESTLQYPSSVDRNDRQVRIVATARHAVAMATCGARRRLGQALSSAVALPVLHPAGI